MDYFKKAKQTNVPSLADSKFVKALGFQIREGVKRFYINEDGVSSGQINGHRDLSSTNKRHDLKTYWQVAHCSFEL